MVNMKIVKDVVIDKVTGQAFIVLLALHFVAPVRPSWWQVIGIPVAVEIVLVIFQLIGNACDSD